MIVSRSLFLILFLVALTAGAASLQSGGSRLREIGTVTKVEVTEDLTSIKDDVRDLREQFELFPSEIRTLWADAQQRAKALKLNATDSAHNIAHRVSAFIKTD